MMRRVSRIPASAGDGEARRLHARNSFPQRVMSGGWGNGTDSLHPVTRDREKKKGFTLTFAQAFRSDLIITTTTRMP